MITVCDNGIAAHVENTLGFPASKVIYGTLESARNFWVRKNNGTEVLPYMSFIRRIEFDDEDRGARRVFVSTPSGLYKATCAKIRLQYTLEHICSRVAEQTDLIKRYIFWATREPVISVPDTQFNGSPWVFPIEFESAEDSSDLEAEEETGRIIRTTFTFAVKAVAVAFDNSGEGTEYGEINSVLGNIHLYDGVSTANAVTVAQINFS